MKKSGKEVNGDRHTDGIGPESLGFVTTAVMPTNPKSITTAQVLRSKRVDKNPVDNPESGPVSMLSNGAISSLSGQGHK